MTEKGDHWRWWIERRKTGRIFRFYRGDHAAADGMQLFEFFLRIGIGRRPQRFTATALAQSRKFGERGRRRSKARNQLCKGNGTDVLCSRKAQPGAALALVQR